MVDILCQKMTLRELSQRGGGYSDFALGSFFSLKDLGKTIQNQEEKKIDLRHF